MERLRTLTRRGLIGLLARVSVCLSWFSLLPRPVTARQADAMLAGVVRDLLPHPAMDAAFYARAAGAVRAAFEGSAAGARLDAALERLDALAGKGGWSAADAAARRAALAALESDPVFPELLNAAIESVYRDPRLWKELGYGGNALAQGGYLHRGFNDIAWLPEE
jgi:hypothetical protein